VVDYRDPANPQLVSRLVNPTGTSAEDVVVYTARFGPLAGRDIAAAGLQVCGGSRLDESFARGLVLWDVTNPAAPVQLGLLNTGCCTRGVHELEVEHRTDLGRTFVYASVPTSEYAEEGSPSGFRDEQGRGDFRLIDVTNPAARWRCRTGVCSMTPAARSVPARVVTPTRCMATAPSRRRTARRCFLPTGTAALSPWT
jgi:hypothetical protein